MSHYIRRSTEIMVISFAYFTVLLNMSSMVNYTIINICL
jgi:hypothetical protein